tara:strand:+ start:110 stop:451 length:342 start_codon:yes stop_codon:yes gene_type:complete
MAVNFTTVGIDDGGEYLTAKAWAMFNIDSSPSIDGGFGFGGITDRATGYVSLEFSTNQPNIYYSVTTAAGDRHVLNQDGSATLVGACHLMATVGGTADTDGDNARNFVTIHGD